MHWLQGQAEWSACDADFDRAPHGMDGLRHFPEEDAEGSACVSPRNVFVDKQFEDLNAGPQFIA